MRNHFLRSWVVELHCNALRSFIHYISSPFPISYTHFLMDVRGGARIQHFRFRWRLSCLCFTFQSAFVFSKSCILPFTMYYHVQNYTVTTHRLRLWQRRSNPYRIRGGETLEYVLSYTRHGWVFCREGPGATASFSNRIQRKGQLSWLDYVIRKNHSFWPKDVLSLFLRAKLVVVEPTRNFLFPEDVNKGS